jgi:hypothetical protein
LVDPENIPQLVAAERARGFPVPGRVDRTGSRLKDYPAAT